VYEYVVFNPGSSPRERAFGTAAVLTFLVLALFTLARLVSAWVSVESRQRRAAKRARKEVAS
jgi:ABC-type phosphate transport system permease subunit